MLTLYAISHLRCTRVNYGGTYAKQLVAASEKEDNDPQLGTPSELLSGAVRKKRLEFVHSNRWAACNIEWTLNTLLARIVRGKRTCEQVRHPYIAPNLL